jgi:hypothetical protein
LESFETLPQQRLRKQTKGFGEEDPFDDSLLKDLLKPVRSEKALLKEQQILLSKGKEELKRQKAAAEAKAKNDPNTWGPQARDRILRVLGLFGFGRWNRMKSETKSGCTDNKTIENFCRSLLITSNFFQFFYKDNFRRSYILQCGVSISDQELSKNDTEFVKEAICAAKTLTNLVVNGQRTFEIPLSLSDEKFINKLKNGIARKSLNRLDSLSKLNRIFQKVSYDYSRKRNELPSKSSDADIIINKLTIQELIKFIPLETNRPPWTKIRPCKCF